MICDNPVFLSGKRPGKFRLLALSVLLSLGCLPRAWSQQPADSAARRQWWKGGYFSFPRPNPKAKIMSRIRVQGNCFINEKGDTVLFRGLSIADPDKIQLEGHWNPELFRHLKDMGVNLVRIPVHPIAWRLRTSEEYLKLLDQAVDWATDQGIYVDIDWHSIGNLEMGLFQAPMYQTSKTETYRFWQAMARHFTGNHTVAFFELFNEPSTYRGQLGSITWEEWKTINERIIHLIRAFDPRTIELVAGFDWAYNLNPIREQPINAGNIAYVTHPYPNKRRRPWRPKWDEDFGFASAKYPVIATEIGFGLRPGQTVGPDDYGNIITRYLEHRGISWVGWVFDPEWQPALLKSWDHFRLSPAGEFFREALHRPAARLRR